MNFRVRETNYPESLAIFKWVVLYLMIQASHPAMHLVIEFFVKKMFRYVIQQMRARFAFQHGRQPPEFASTNATLHAVEDYQ